MKKRITILILLAAMLLLSACGVHSKLEKIDVAQAQNVALNALGISGEALSYIGAELKTHDGQQYYEVQLKVDGTDYVFAIDAISGVIIEQMPTSQPTPESTEAVTESVGGCIGVEEAYEIAITHAGYTHAHAYMTAGDLEERDGKWVYVIRFVGVSSTYRYDIDAMTGEVLDVTCTTDGRPQARDTAKVDPEMNVYPVSPAEDDPDMNVTSVSPSTSVTYVSGNPIPQENQAILMITPDQAITKALAHAGYTEEEVMVMYAKHHRSNNNGTPWNGEMLHMYDVYFRDADGVYFHYEINAVEGTVYSVESSAELESLNSPGHDATEPVTLPDNAISRERAIARALSDAGLTAMQVIVHACQPDYDHGVYEYDVLFQVKGTSTFYTYEINAIYGKILSGGHGVMMFGAIDEMEARSIAVQQVKGADFTHIVAFATNTAYGKMIHQGIIVYDGMQYEFAIDGYSGFISRWHVTPVNG